MIKINGKDLKTSRPSDLDAQLIASTGHGEREVQSLLNSGPGLAARALMPHLAEPGDMTVGDLAKEIASDPDAIAEIGKLYAPAATPAVKATDKGDGK